MPHNDSDPVLVHYSSSRNITFNNDKRPDEIGYTWGEWRALSPAERDAALDEYVWSLVEVYVVSDVDLP